MNKTLIGIFVCVTLSVHAQDAGPERMFSLIRACKTDTLEWLLSHGANPNTIFNGYSALMGAALNGTAEEMKILIRYGANVNYINDDSLTALWLAIPDEEKTMLLLDKGSNIFVNARGGTSMLQKLVSIPGAAPLVQLFLAKGTDVRKNNDGNSLVVRATISGDTAILGILIRLGLDINEADPEGVPPIIYAAQYHNLPTLAMLAAHGADVNAVSKRRGMTALMNAARVGDEEIVIYLLEHGANARVVSKSGYTALTYWGFSEADRPEITQSMYDQLGKAAFNKAGDGADALYWAQKRGETRAVQLLRKYMQQ